MGKAQSANVIYYVLLIVNLPSLDQVEEFEVYDITEDTTVVDFTKQKIKNYEVASGYGFYEFIDGEYIEPSKRIMLLDKVNATSKGKAMIINVIFSTKLTNFATIGWQATNWCWCSWGYWNNGRL